jgi:hypothetical protein
MHYFGAGILPSSLPDELSRGHPILIPFIYGVGFNLFGCKMIVAKMIGAVIYSIGILYIYRIFILVFSPRLSCLFSFLLFIQPCFLSQSVLILPEIPLMVAAIIAFYYFIKGQHIQVSIALIIALFIKESAIILPFTFYFADVLVNKFKLKHFICILLLPLAFIITFFAIQYSQRGYIFYPLHTSLIKLEMYYIHERFRDFSKFAFHGQGREFLWFYLPALFILFKSIQFRKNLSELIPKININERFTKINLTLLLLFAAGLSFTVLNYFLSRYTLYFLIFAYIAFFNLFFNVAKWNFAHYISIAVLLISAVFYNTGKTYTDVDFSYVNHIKSCKVAMEYLNTPVNKGKTVGMDFPLSVTTWDKNSGYFNDLYIKPTVLGDSADVKEDYYVFTFPGNMENSKTLNPNLILVKKIESGYAYVNIYKRKIQ